jgi:hypothetical protein
MHATILGREPSPMELFFRNVRMKWWPWKRGATARGQPCSSLCGMLIFNLCFLSYYFSWTCSPFFQDTYNIRMTERYEDDSSTHSDFNPDLWLETGTSSGLNRNYVYDLSNITVKDLQKTPNISTFGCS